VCADSTRDGEATLAGTGGTHGLKKLGIELWSFSSVLVVFKGPVQSSYLTPRGVNHGPEPVQTDAQTNKTATELNRTGPIRFG
jgi:hypothetical protein